MKRKFKFSVLLFKEGDPYMGFIFNTVDPMYFSQAYNLLYAKIHHDYPAALGYTFTLTSVSSEPCIELAIS